MKTNFVKSASHALLASQQSNNVHINRVSQQLAPRLAQLSLQNHPTHHTPFFDASSAECAKMRDSRPEWSNQWRAAKTGGPNHRRHTVRSGLMRDCLKANLEHAKQTQQLDKFFAAANRLLGQEPFDVDNRKDADLVLDQLYSTMHNNHMNIFIGSGGYNQMAGTMAHGLEKNEATYLASLQAADSIEALNTLALDWIRQILSYALCEYMDFTPAQETAVYSVMDSAIVDSTILDSAFELSNTSYDKKGIQRDLDQLQLFSGAERNESPMEINVHKQRQTAILETGELLVARLQYAFDDASNEIGLGEEALTDLKQQLKAIAMETLDSCDLDLSESPDDEIRVMQNEQAILATQRFSELIEKPDIDAFEASAQDFLQMESKGGDILGIGSNHENWFSNTRSREKLFSAITSETSLPTVESPRFNPREWKPEIRKNFRAFPGTQRVQVVPSTLVRQVGYTVSNYAFALHREEDLMRAYERMLKRPEGSINSIDSLQRHHAQLIKEVHNNPTNIFIGSRSQQIARENILFALESNSNKLNTILQQSNAPSPSNPPLASTVTSTTDTMETIEELYQWRSRVIQAAVEGYLHLTPYELDQLNQAVSKALHSSNHQTFRDEIVQVLKQELELYSDKVRVQGPIARYDSFQLESLRDKIEVVLDLLSPLKEGVDAIVGDRSITLADKQEAIRSLVEALVMNVTHVNSEAPNPEIRKQQNELQRFINPLLEMKDYKGGGEVEGGEGVGERGGIGGIGEREEIDLIERFESVMTPFLETASIAKTEGLASWGKGVGAKTDFKR